VSNYADIITVLGNDLLKKLYTMKICFLIDWTCERYRRVDKIT